MDEQDDVDRRPQDPTRAEIQREAERIRAGWTLRQKRSRASQPVGRTTWTPPVYHAGDLYLGPEIFDEVRD